MPTFSTAEPPAKSPPKSPEDWPIYSTNYCALCLYNIPRGSLMLVLPGLSLLLVGVVLISLTSESWGAGTAQLALMLLIIGGVITLGGAIYWTIMWGKHRPAKTKSASKQSVFPHVRGTSDPVELVAVYHVSGNQNQGQVAPPYSMSTPGPSGVVTLS